MAVSADTEDEDLFEPDAEEADDEEQEGQDQIDEGEEPEDDEEETIIGFGEDGAGDEDEAGLVPHLRATLRAKDAEIRKLRESVPPPKPIEVGPKPTMEGYEYDEEAYDAAKLAWDAKVAAAKAAENQAQEPAKAAQVEFRGALEQFATEKAALKVKGYDEAESDVTAAFNAEQTATVILAAKNKAAVIYALGKHPERLKQLAAIKNPVTLAVAVSELERDLKVTTKRRAPEPEGVVRGSAPLATGKGDKYLAKLEAKADETGDRTELIAYRKKHPAKG